MVSRLDAALLPSEALTFEADCYLVVDVLRATTTIATLFAQGLGSLLAVSDIDLARERAAADGRLLFGEVGGLPPVGFDHGNSPVEAAAAAVRGRDAVLFTTNGTAALCSLPPGAAVITGALANATAAANFAARYDRVVAVCSGNAAGTRFSLEDFTAAGVILASLAATEPSAHIGDGARAAIEVAAQSFDISRAQHAAYLRSLGLGSDVDFAAVRDTSAAVPLVVERGECWALLRDAAAAS